MKHMIVITILLVTTAINAQAARKPHKARSSSSTVTYNHDSRDPDIGWHSEGGWRTCHYDCDNPEIPGSGFTCKDVVFLGMKGRQCSNAPGP
jgi:hypothetical protein